jgi:cytochrome c oxidase cbb3-type subunit 1
MMFIPVATVAVNHHLTMVGHFDKLKSSPTLRFVVFGAMCYTAVSVQGSLTSLRVVNETVHFTHYTVAHAHLGVYAFFSMVMFGAFYYVLPRLLNSEWHSARLIRMHFWCSAAGIILYWAPLTWGGWIQGRRMLDPDVPFLDVVAYTVPWLHLRSGAGLLIAAGHAAFAVLVWNMLKHRGAALTGPTLLRRPRAAAERGTV